MKTKLSVLCILAIIALLAGTPLVAFAGESGGSIATGEMPAQWPLLLIPVVTPLIIAGVKWLVPKIPGSWLPVIAPMLGASLDVIAHFAAGTNLTLWQGALLGLCGVGVRELYDRIVAKNMSAGIVAIFLALGALPFAGCAEWRLTPTQKETISSALIEVAKAGLKFGLNALAQKYPKIAPFVPNLEARFQITFSNAAAIETPEAFAEAIRSDVFAVVSDPEAQKAVLDLLAGAINEELKTKTEEQAVAGGTSELSQRAYAARVAALLKS